MYVINQDILTRVISNFFITFILSTTRLFLDAFRFAVTTSAAATVTTVAISQNRDAEYKR